MVGKESSRPHVRALILAGLVWAIGALAGASFTPAAAHAQTTARTAVPSSLVFELWTAADRIIFPTDTAEERLLRSAQSTVSAIVYGYRFWYIPRDPARNVAGLFELEPLHTIPWGDPALYLAAAVYEDNALYGQFHYRLSTEQQARIAAFRHSRAVISGGQGYGPLLEGHEGYRIGLQAALEDAVRSHLRTLTRNRPRESSGTIALVEPPRVRIIAGQFHIRATAVIEVEELRPYLSQ